MTISPLRVFNPYQTIRVTHRGLPHWEQDGVCAFVTMRLSDSIPLTVKTKVDEIRKHWMRLKGLAPGSAPGMLFEVLSAQERQRFQRLASRSYQRALDKGCGSCLFKEAKFRDHLMDVLASGDHVGYQLGDGVIMPNHVHLLIQPMKGKSLKNELSSIRRISARSINADVGRSGNLWQPEPFDHLVRSMEQFKKFQRYIECNPTSAGLMESEYTYWTS